MSVFWCPSCKAMVTTAVDRSKRGRTAGPEARPVIIRERHCLHCERVIETMEFQLEDGWQKAPAYQPPSIPRLNAQQSGRMRSG